MKGERLDCPSYLGTPTDSTCTDPDTLGVHLHLQPLGRLAPFTEPGGLLRI